MKPAKSLKRKEGLNMAKVYAMIANGTEEVECLAVVDLLRRSGVETVLVSVEEDCEIISSHKVRITADAVLADTDLSDGDVIFLPGGMPGAERLAAAGGIGAGGPGRPPDRGHLCGPGSGSGTPRLAQGENRHLLPRL